MRCGAALALTTALLLALPGPAAALPRSAAAARRLQQLQGIAADLPAYTRAGCHNFTSDQWQPLRPGFHLTVPYGWMNDPHGMFQLNGTTHVFFQYNPKAIAWGAPFWGHVVSQDLARWTWLPPALLPDRPYDFNGVWSGAATVADGGLPVLTYTAASSLVPEMGNFFQKQALAVPEDIRDPLLKRWKKSDTNPFLIQVPPGGTNFQFRDPTEARHAVWIALTSPANPAPLPKSHYALAVGVQAFCLGGGAIFTAPSMGGPWSYAGNLYNQLSIEPEVDGKCEARPLGNASWPGPAYGGPCDQFGAHCRMWEVVDFLELEPGLFMIKWDDQSNFRGDFNREWYVLGNGPWDYSALRPPTPAGSAAAAAAAAAAAGGGGAALPAPPAAAPKPVFGSQYSGYPNTTASALPASTLPGASTDRISSSSFNAYSAAATSASKSLFRGELDGQRFAPMPTDYGSIYASMIFRTNDSRQVMFSWIYETAAGCQGSCSDQLPPVVAKQGFKGAQTMPRQLRYSRATKTLCAYPVPEVQALRGKQLWNGSSVAALPLLPATATLVPLSTLASVPRPVARTANRSSSSSSSAGSAGAITARQMEIQLNFTVVPAGASFPPAPPAPAPAGGPALPAAITLQRGEFAAGVRVLTGGGSYTDVYLRGSLAINSSSSSAAASLSALSVWVDRRAAGGATNTSHIEGGPVPLSVAGAWDAARTPLGLSVWVDHSVLEVFALGGLARVTSRVYPDGDDVAWGAAAWGLLPPGGGSGVRLRLQGAVWEVQNAWLPPDC